MSGIAANVSEWEFAREQKTLGMRYDILVDDKPVKVGLFAEEVMRWLGDAMEESQ